MGNNVVGDNVLELLFNGGFLSLGQNHAALPSLDFGFTSSWLIDLL
jgi:hypothetical protein